MVRLGGADGGIRRYRLARLDEVALASPPEKATPPEDPDPAPTEADDDLDSRSNRAA